MSADADSVACEAAGAGDGVLVARSDLTPASALPKRALVVWGFGRVVDGGLDDDEEGALVVVEGEVEEGVGSVLRLDIRDRREATGLSSPGVVEAVRQPYWRARWTGDGNG